MRNPEIIRIFARDMINNIAFDLGGVVIALSYESAVRRFEQIGLRDARSHLDAFCQHGIFGDLERGDISAEQFRMALSELIGREISSEECSWAWHGYVENVPQRNLDMLLRLRNEGYKVCLLSNTNPYMMQWACSPEFDGRGHAISHYFDHLYLSYECRQMKPSPDIFRTMLQGQQSSAAETLFIDDSPRNCEVAQSLGIRTLCPHDNEDWTPTLASFVRNEKGIRY